MAKTPARSSVMSAFFNGLVEPARFVALAGLVLATKTTRASRLKDFTEEHIDTAIERQWRQMPHIWAYLAGIAVASSALGAAAIYTMAQPAPAQAMVRQQANPEFVKS